MKREKVYCKVLKADVYKDTKGCLDYTCLTCPELIKKSDPKQKPQKVSTTNKKKKSSKKSTLQPFSDYVRADGIGGFINPKTNDLPFEIYLEGEKQNPATESEKLKVLVRSYKAKGLTHFWDVAREFLSSGYLTKEEWGILCDAEAGNIRAVQLLVKANPEVIVLPFVADVMIEILRKYKNTLTSKCRNKDKKIYSNDIRLEWEDFLPARKKLPYSAYALGKLVNVAGKEFNLDKDEAFEKLTAALGVGIETLKKKVRFPKNK